MANLKQDVLNNLGNKKYYTELELARLANDGNTNYENKVADISEILKELAKIDLATQMVDKYFQEQQTQEQQAAAPQGQSHAE